MKINSIDYTKFIHIKGAQSNNLKDVEVLIPKNKLVVVTGVSGSGKSTLVMDTLYAEGHRRYVESLSSYARQFLSRMKKPNVEYIKGIAPAIAIEQKVVSGNNRSTVGSMTEINDFLRLLFTHIGKTYSPISDQIVVKSEVSDVVDELKKFELGTRLMISTPLNKRYKDRLLKKQLEIELHKGFNRIIIDETIEDLEEILSKNTVDLNKKLSQIKFDIQILIDRIVIDADDENWNRISDSVFIAFKHGDGRCVIISKDGSSMEYNNKLEADGMIFSEPRVQLFNFNNPYGACPKCEGYGKIIGIDPQKVIPNPSLSVYDWAVAPWKGEKNGKYRLEFLDKAHLFDFPLHKPINELTDDEYQTLWKGNEHVTGIKLFFENVQNQSHKIQYRVMLARYRGRTVCDMCDGGRLNKQASYVKVGSKNIVQLSNMSIENLIQFFDSLQLNETDAVKSKRLIEEIVGRLEILNQIGLGYLNLNRISNTLSGGETQRINLTRTLGSNLSNSIYILDEPSIGLHAKDTTALIKVLKNLRDAKNTVIVVEHEEEIIQNADYIIDLGPKAGIYGGEIVFHGDYAKLPTAKNSLTRDYILGDKVIATLNIDALQSTSKIRFTNVYHNNLRNVDVQIPLFALTTVCGVSGSGKSSLVTEVVFPTLKKYFELFGKEITSDFQGDYHLLNSVQFVGQNPLGRSSRSNPATYTKAYDHIRKLMASQQSAKIKGLNASHFSFNTDGGRCDNCLGDGEITIEMQFLADVKLVCDDCHGKRFKPEILEVKYKDHNVFDILELSIVEALDLFEDRNEIIKKLKPLADVGLDYVKLGQASSTLSGGESQRVKLSTYLSEQKDRNHTFFIFDEPTTGLHFEDVKKLLNALKALVEKGNTVLIVEHNLDVIMASDWIIELGPLGGDKGGRVMYQGEPTGLLKVKESFTSQFLNKKLNGT